MTLRQVFTTLVVLAALLFGAIMLLWITAIVIGSGMLGAVGAVLLMPLVITFFAGVIISDVIWDWFDF